MKRLRLSDLRKKSNKWFRKYGVAHKEEFASMKAIEYFAKRSYESLPKRDKEYLELDKNLAIKQSAMTIYHSGNAAHMDIYKSMKERVKNYKRLNSIGTAEYIYKAFREQRPDVYAKYNSYVYRLGSSAAKWFIANMDYIQEGKVSYIHVKLPVKMAGVVYNELYIEFDFSGDLINFAEMQ